MSAAPRVAVIGLGYVGLPLAVVLARHGPVTGYDRDPTRIGELRAGKDRTGEVEPEALRAVGAAGSLVLTDDPEDLRGHDVHVVAVPTPVDDANQPDLAALEGACRMIGPRLRPGDVVAFESTVYPGCTEEVCGPVLERESGLRCGVDFFLGYSPERINPGDREHTIERVTKIVAGQTPEVAERLCALYGKVTGGNIFRARDIRTAEAAKVIENAQRDINVAFVNEVAMICQRLGLSSLDVLEAAGTKWNFLKFRPGLVGGHCIGVDPFYLAYKARAVGHAPQIILAGRAVNDAMPGFLAARLAALLPKGARVLALGLTFKENVPDLRNSKAAELVQKLLRHDIELTVHDACADPDEAWEHYGIDLAPELPESGAFDAVLGVVAHRPYAELSGAALAALLRPGGLVADIKGMWRATPLPVGLRRWTL
ncbi:MAG TPA: nucleotide sugar dehydrogenase [Geminicoccaceae bacterium]|nr:nucleotide sugar dehydrogenase [Geminicoccaceae bacterium]